MKVRIASEKDKEKWDQFVDREGGSFFQYFDWKFVYEDTPLKHLFIPLIIENNTSEILGIFPIEENLKSLFSVLTSLPLGASDGFLIKDNLSEQEKKIIIQVFLDYIDANFSRTHSSLTIREHLSFSEGPKNPSPILLDNGYDWSDNTTTRLPCTYLLKLERPFKEKIWNNLWSKKLRKRIRHAKKSGAEVIVDDEFIYLEDLFEMQIRTVKKFGVVQKKEDIIPIINIFKKKIKLFVCLLDSRPISAALCYFTPTIAHLAIAPYKSGSEDYLTNTLPICASIHYACENGYRYYDMGYTTSPEIAFHKEKFKATCIPLRIYTKKFSYPKVISNKTYDYIKSGGKKIMGLLRK